ncbi:uncharacterized protein PgNI_08404 [Pyricularia grisea]|uniref:Uncharacterized protein n=1 Tax=Pyricularia grisea TaxID=148305 RepID=A0A6P8AV85_PYRGI|nr:uncharacterized protein PgNI_08404 [Pyricularia grisea]TLD06133.1 hypothetical protein PgNI_08404 [Pyricularia grisea]
MKEVPDFKSINHPRTSPNTLIDQELSSAMTDQLHRLSRFCELEHSVLPNVLRLGSTYSLSLHVPDD